MSLEDLVQVFEGQGLNETAIEALGLPILPDDEKPGCGASQELDACTREGEYQCSKSSSKKAG